MLHSSLLWSFGGSTEQDFYTQKLRVGQQPIRSFCVFRAGLSASTGRPARSATAPCRSADRGDQLAPRRRGYRSSRHPGHAPQAARSPGRSPHRATRRRRHSRTARRFQGARRDSAAVEHRDRQPWARRGRRAGGAQGGGEPGSRAPRLAPTFSRSAGARPISSARSRSGSPLARLAVSSPWRRRRHMARRDRDRCISHAEAPRRWSDR